MKRRDHDVTKHSAPDTRDPSLHRRLTVALASTADRALLAQALVGDLTAAGTPGGASVICSEDLWTAAGAVAETCAADRAQTRSRLDLVAARTMHDHETASSQLESLATWRQTLIDGAAWALATQGALAGYHEAVESTRAALSDRQHERRAAEQGLERVLEQRQAAAQAIEQADGELGEMTGLGMDESGLRRELEAAGRAVQDAETAHGEAVGLLKARQAEHSRIRQGREDLAAISSMAGPPVVDRSVKAVAEALVALRTVSSGFDDVDPQAVALGEAWRDLTADIANLSPIEAPPDEDDLSAAGDRVAALRAELTELDKVAQSSALTATERAAIDAAHTAVLEAEERTGRRVGAAFAKKRADDARTAERTLLDHHGFPAYIDVVLTGGRSAAVNPRRGALERELMEASSTLEALTQAGQGSLERQHLESERRRLHAHVMEVLGVDPADRTLDLLKEHRQVPKGLQLELIDALAEVGVRPVGISLEAAASAFLQSHGVELSDYPEEDGYGWPPVDLSLATPEAAEQATEDTSVDALIESLGRDIDAAQSEVDRLAEELHLAQRSVVAFEGELTVRAGEDVARAKRAEAADQLRTQIEAVSASLEQAEQTARAQIVTADQHLVAAEGEFDRAAAAVSDLARQARKLAEEIPIDQRPEGDPLQELPVLAGRLQVHAEVLDPEVARAETAVEVVSVQLGEALAAAGVAAARADGPQAEDLIAGLEKVVACEASETLLVLDEPFVGIDQAVRVELLDTLLRVGADRQVVLLSEDPDVLGWAIELPADVAAAMPADALLGRIKRAGGDRQPVPAASSAPVDITASAEPTPPEIAPTHPSTSPSTPSPDPARNAPPTRRWAGQR